VASQLYKDQIKALLEGYYAQVRRATDEESDMSEYVNRFRVLF
jgi:hypothetical protein